MHIFTRINQYKYKFICFTKNKNINGFKSIKYCFIQGKHSFPLFKTAYQIWHCLSMNWATIKGLFINDVTQAGGGGSHFCDTMFEGLSKTGNLVWQRGSENLKICETSLMNGPLIEIKQRDRPWWLSWLERQSHANLSTQRSRVKIQAAASFFAN